MWQRVKNKTDIIVHENAKIRAIPKSKLEIPTKTTNYWNQILEDIETEAIKVRQPQLPLLPSLISSKCSVSNINKICNNSNNSVVDIKHKMKKKLNEPVVKISPPSPTHNVPEYLNTSAELPSVSNVEPVNNLMQDFRVSQSDMQCLDTKSKTSEQFPESSQNPPEKKIIQTNSSLPSLFKITRLTKISKCINNFLDHTKDKIKTRDKSPAVKNLKLAKKRLDDTENKGKVLEKFEEKKVEAENTFKKSDIQRQSLESLNVIDIDEDEEIEEANATQLDEKKVCFPNTIDDENTLVCDAEYRPAPRRRAPSIAIASALPSFGKNVSSLDHSDSYDSIDDSRSDKDTHKHKTIRNLNKPSPKSSKSSDVSTEDDNSRYHQSSKEHQNIRFDDTTSSEAGKYFYYQEYLEGDEQQSRTTRNQTKPILKTSKGSDVLTKNIDSRHYQSSKEHPNIRFDDTALSEAPKYIFYKEYLQEDEQQSETIGKQMKPNLKTPKGSDVLPKDINSRCYQVSKQQKPNDPKFVQVRKYYHCKDVHKRGKQFETIRHHTKLSLKSSKSSDVSTKDDDSRYQSSEQQKSADFEIPRKHRRRRRKSWPKKSVLHLLRALKLMKTNTRKSMEKKMADDFNYSPSSQISFSVSGSKSITDEHHRKTYHLECIQSDDLNEDESSSTSFTSSCSFSSVRKRPIGKPSIYDEKKNVPSSGFIEDSRQTKSELGSGRISSEFDDSGINTSDGSFTEKGKSIFGLDDIPRIDRMYQRKKGDKCLACLHVSLKNESFGADAHWDVEYSISSFSDDESVSNKINEILRCKLYEDNDDLLNRKSTLDLDESNFQTELSKNNHMSEVVSGLELGRNNSADQFRSRTDVACDKKSIISARSLKSNLSLISDRSKTISDQDDSDRDGGGDDGGEMEENIVESRSKFLAPCHAPLNLRPSLEPLKALRNKKARSIQSRMASLEKSTEAESDDKSEDDEAPIVITKTKESNEKKIASDKTDGDKTSPKMLTNEELSSDFSAADQVDQNDFFNLLEKVKREAEIREQIKTNKALIAEKIFRELGLNRDENEYNRAFDPNWAPISDAEILDISKRGFDENETVPEILNELVKLEVKRLSDRFPYKRRTSVNADLFKNEEMIRQLLTLLVDAKFYIHYQNNSTNSHVPINAQKAPINPRQLRRVLPVKSYNLIAPILGFPEWYPKRWTSVKDASKLKAAFKKDVVKQEDQIKSSGASDTAIDLIAHPATQKQSSSSEPDQEQPWRTKKLNPYGLFITKPRRKAIIWRPLTKQDLEGYDPEATLKNRAARITDEICADFCQWLRSLGGFDSTIDEEVLKDMFETDFSADACKAMQVSIKELPKVPTAVAKARNCPEAEELERTRKLLMKDVKAERKKPRLVAFGAALPEELKYIPPKNEVNSNWLECGSVPQDLKTMEVVWKDITHLDSVQGFIDWMKNENDMELPEILKNPPAVATKKSNHDIGLRRKKIVKLKKNGL